LKKLLVNSNLYEASQSLIDLCIKMAVDHYKTKNAILAVEKNNIVEMKRNTYKSQMDLYKVIREYTEQGFSVHYNLKSGGYRYV
jgi:hypothetical protein